MGKAIITVHKQNRGKLVHIEAPGCIVNIRVGLKDEDGREVTAIEVLPDADRFPGEVWGIVDDSGVAEKRGRSFGALAIRVRRDK